jgi:tRNA A37 threonylcarbamoyladenosine modification protein TsaB
MNILGIYADPYQLQLSVFDSNCKLYLENQILPLKMGDLLPQLNIITAEILKKYAVEKIAVHKGPATFATLRGVLSFAQGLSFGLNCPISAPTLFDVLKVTYADEIGTAPTWLLIDGRADFYYAQCISDSLSPTPVKILKKDILSVVDSKQQIICDAPVDIARTVIAFDKNLADTLCQISASDVDEIYTHHFNTLEPYYMHLPDYKKSPAK